MSGQRRVIQRGIQIMKSQGSAVGIAYGIAYGFAFCFTLGLLNIRTLRPGFDVDASAVVSSWEMRAWDNNICDFYVIIKKVGEDTMILPGLWLRYLVSNTQLML